MVNILHLSDLHLTESDDCQRKTVIESFIAELLLFLEEEPSWKPDFIAFSGDITNRGTTREFECAEKLLNQILSELKLKPDKLIVVPGNHDKFWRDAEKKMDKLLQNNTGVTTLKDELKNYDTDIRSKMVDKDSREDLFKHFNDFSQNLKLNQSESLNVKGWDPKKERTQGVYLKTKNQSNIIFVGINSAYFCVSGEMDYGRLQLDREYIDRVERLINEKRSADRNTIVISILHHNPSWFKWEDKLSLPNAPAVYSKVISFSDLILSGHEHSVKYYPDFLNSSSYSIIGGATYTDPVNNETFYSNNFSIIKIDEKKLCFKRRNFLYHSVEGKDKQWENYDNDINYSLHPIPVEDHEKLKTEKNRLEREVDILKRLVLKNEDYNHCSTNYDVSFKIGMEGNNDSLLFKRLFGLDGLKEVALNGSETVFYTWNETCFFSRIDSKYTDGLKEIEKILESPTFDDKKMILVVENCSVHDFLNSKGFNKFVFNGKLLIISAEIFRCN